MRPLDKDIIQDHAMIINKLSFIKFAYHVGPLKNVYEVVDSLCNRIKIT